MDPARARVFSHPLRVRILSALAVRSASAAELARECSETIGKVAYHLSVLCDAGYAEPVDDEDPDSPEPRYGSALI